MALNPIDTAIQSVTPTVMVPRHEPFVPMSGNGHRFLCAADGLWLEARRPWLYLRYKLAEQQQVPMPYGEVSAEVEILTAPRALLEEFVDFGQRQHPLECAAWITWNEDSGHWRLIPIEATFAGHSAVEFDRPRLGDGEHLVIDLHSHGAHRAFFSAQDDRDDRGEFKVAGVFGNLGGEIEAAFRLCANGKFIDLGNQWRKK